MGYGEAVRDILTELRKRCTLNEVQTVLISATLSDDVQNLADLSLKNPKFVNVGVGKMKRAEGLLEQYSFLE
jgi:superfamily II DNA/RNA helicase